jgi:hypothetical protein
MQVRSNYTEIEDFLADESFKYRCSSVMTKKLGRMDFRRSKPRQISWRSTTLVISYEGTTNTHASDYYINALESTWDKIEKRKLTQS